MMTRSKARQILLGETLSAPSFFEFVLARKMGAKAIEQTTWIPVSERLPEEGTNVLFCNTDGDIRLGYHVPQTPKTQFSEQGSWDIVKNVEAWIPLPEHYKEEGEGE